MITLPKSIEYCEAYLTLRCSYSCHYCINQYSNVKRKRQELTSKKWLLGLNNIDFGNIPLTLGGGEPTIHKEFYEIINQLRPKTKIDLLTNGTFNIYDFLRFTKPERFTKKYGSSYKSIRFSYHIGQTDEKELINKVSVLQDAGYQVGIFSINHPENLKANVEMAERCRKAGTYFFVRDFLGFYADRLYGFFRYPNGLNGNRKKCQCRTSELLIAPDGKRFKCHRDLYADETPTGDILRMDFDVKDEFRDCDNYGVCNPCDLKGKLSKDLDGKRCAVEIKEIV